MLYNFYQIKNHISSLKTAENLQDEVELINKRIKLFSNDEEQIGVFFKMIKGDQYFRSYRRYGVPIYHASFFEIGSEADHIARKYKYRIQKVALTNTMARHILKIFLSSELIHIHFEDYCITTDYDLKTLKKARRSFNPHKPLRYVA